jgi:hypothetical protein
VPRPPDLRAGGPGRRGPSRGSSRLKW